MQWTASISRWHTRPGWPRIIASSVRCCNHHHARREYVAGGLTDRVSTHAGWVRGCVLKDPACSRGARPGAQYLGIWACHEGRPRGVGPRARERGHARFFHFATEPHRHRPPAGAATSWPPQCCWARSSSSRYERCGSRSQWRDGASPRPPASHAHERTTERERQRSTNNPSDLGRTGSFASRVRVC